MNILPLAFMLAVTCPALGQPSGMATVKGGEYTPLYGAGTDGKVTVSPFLLDTMPVTRAQYAGFVREHPKWRRSNVKRLFANESYLGQWVNDTTPSADLRESPVTQVSWFAAREYCRCMGKRLPTLHEWEFAAMADESRVDARADSLFSREILRGYETARTYRRKAGTGTPNLWGIRDLHGLVWEWTEDFNAVIITGGSRTDKDTDKGLFCASGSVGASDLMDYAAFMRYAFRASVKADYCVLSLGFRCAADIPEQNP